MASKEVDRQLLFSYLEGNCSRDQLLQVREYLQDEAYRDSLHRFMEEEWKELNGRQFPPLPDMEDKYSKFRSAYIASQQETLAIVSRNRTTLPVRHIRRMTAIAAALLLGAVAVWLLLTRLGGRQAHDAATPWLSWHNEPGKHREILLPDSTRVHLGPAGTLRYSRDDDRSRLIQLEGEAYFIVKHDARRPFTVVTGALSTRDIGTEFNIRYYPGEPTIAIVVASGKVQVLHTPAATSSATLPSSVPLAALTAGQLLQYDSLTRQSGITDVSNPSMIGAWRKGILSFRRQRLKEVTDELQHYYGVSFRYSDPAAENIQITTLLDDKSLGDALDIVSLTAGVHFTHEGNEILVK